MTSLWVTNNWLTSGALAVQLPAVALRAALQSEGLLTTALQLAYGAPTVVECIGQPDWLHEGQVLGLQRDVILKVQGAVRVRASTLMPQMLIAALPWLTGLGNSALGEVLAQRVQCRRSDFEYARVDTALLTPLVPHTVPFCWARRYRFSLTHETVSGELQVMEVFLPGVLEHLAAAQAAQVTATTVT